MFFVLNNPKNQVTGDGYGIFNKKQSKTEIAKAIASLIQTPADLDFDDNDIIIVLVKPEKPNQRLLRLNLPIEHYKKYHVNEDKSKNLVKIIKREMDNFETVSMNCKEYEL
jgi:hypothetical protein